MASIAPVASPTPIICVTMFGNTPDSRSGSTMVRPSSIAFRTFIRASSSTALPDVRAVMLNPSRIGTPEVIRVPRVRVNRATAILHRSAQLHGFFNVDRQSLQNDVENTAGFTSLNHVGGEIVEHLGMLAHGIGQGGAAFYRGPHSDQRLLECRVLLVRTQNFQTLHQ